VELWTEFTKLFGAGEAKSPEKKPVPSVIDFTGDPVATRTLIEGERLAYGHLVNPAFATETSKIDPLPHQRIAVYEHMLPKSRLRYLLADDAGAGKTIMTGLYIREMLSRRLIRRVLIIPPAGLVGNWQSELLHLFGLSFQILTGPSFRSAKSNPFAPDDSGLSDLVICSVDTLRGQTAFSRLAAEEVEPYDLVVFDEAHKLTAREKSNFSVQKSERYLLAEALAGAPNRKAEWALAWSARHLLLLTATPHMGVAYPFYALWRLLEPQTFSTKDAFDALPQAARKQWFVRRTKEEMVTLDGKPLYPIRHSNTFSYDLETGQISEQELYDRTTDYLRFVYNRARLLNRTAAQLALSVFQRRLASSTFALLCSLQRREKKLENLINEIAANPDRLAGLARRHAEELAAVEDTFEDKTGDDETSEAGSEENEIQEDEILGKVLLRTIEELRDEMQYVTGLRELAQAVHASGQQSKFARLQTILKKYGEEKLLIFTEHKDTLKYIIDRLEGCGYAGQLASIHGGMDYVARGEQVDYFRKPITDGGARIMVCTDAAGEGVNLQFCWVMVNWDVPWNPARLEQRMGRIHRYGQRKDEVFIFNLVAGKTREGRVVATLLRKLEEIRDQLGSDKVFDVIGRLFEGKSMVDFMTDAFEHGAEAAAERLGGILTKEQVEVVAEQERRNYGEGGEVSQALPRLVSRMNNEVYAQLLPGHVRRYVKDASSVRGFSLNQVGADRFKLVPNKRGALDPLLPSLLAESVDTEPLICFRRPVDDGGGKPVWFHPGEAAFDAMREWVFESASPEALRGAIVVDPHASQAYLLHVAVVTVMRRSDPEIAVYRLPQTLEQRLVALRHDAEGNFSRCAVEETFLFQPSTGGMPASAQRVALSIKDRVEEARAYLVGDVARSIAQEHRGRINADLTQRLERVRQGFIFEQSELLAARSNWRKKLRDGHAKAEREIARIKERQQVWEARKQENEQTILVEPSLIGAGPIEFLAHLLVCPPPKGKATGLAASPQDAHDDEVEMIAMEVANAYEEAQGGRVQDVHTGELALKAGLPTAYPGFDLLSHRLDGSRRCIEVKGRRTTGDIEITANEWSAACNRGEDYWLYSVFECASPNPQLIVVQDPFKKLMTTVSSFSLAAEQILAEGEKVEL
jgi:superfamily II DNA or RNA helicase